MADNKDMWKHVAINQPKLGEDTLVDRYNDVVLRERVKLVFYNPVQMSQFRMNYSIMINYENTPDLMIH